jgi:hypothetical protein
MPQVLNIRHLPGFKEKRPTIPEGASIYERWLRLQPGLMEALHELRGLDLVCWCAPCPATAMCY